MQVVKLKLMPSASLAALLAATVSMAPASAQTNPLIVEPGTAPSSPATAAPPATVLAPPVDTQTQDSNVWNWQDVPKNQEIVIDRAVFDQGGYRLYCHTGETIVVPFADQNMYVMRFGRSDGQAYFTTDGTTPILYIPLYGFLENADVVGAKWYPLTPTYDYTVPVYASPAPNWTAYSTMGWYPGMVCFGGYVGNTPVAFGITLLPTPGWFITIDGWEIDSWQKYGDYAVGHPAQRMIIHDAPGYRYDHFPPRGPAHGNIGRPFGGSPYGRPAATTGDPRSSRFANPAFQAHVDVPSTPSVSHFANPNLAQPATAAAVQLTALKTRPVLLGNPRFGNHSAMATLPSAGPRPVVDTGSAAITSLDRLPKTSGLGLSTHESFLDKPGTPSGERSPLWSEKIYHDSGSHSVSGEKSSGAGGLFKKAFKSASTWAHDYAKSSGGSGSGHSGDHSEHSGHSEKESRSSSSGSSGASGGGKRK